MGNPAKQATLSIQLAMILGLGLGIVIFVLATFAGALGSTSAGNLVDSIIALYTSPEVLLVLGAVVVLTFLGLVAPAVKPLWDMITGMGGKGGRSYD